MDSFVIKTERKVEQEKKSKHKRRHTVVLSDGEDDQAQARAAESESFPKQLMAYLKRIDGMHEVFSSEESIVFDRSGTLNVRRRALPRARQHRQGNCTAR